MAEIPHQAEKSAGICYIMGYSVAAADRSPTLCAYVWTPPVNALHSYLTLPPTPRSPSFFSWAALQPYSPFCCGAPVRERDRIDETRLFDAHGQRKYLHAVEARRLLAAAASAEEPTRLFCRLLYYTGCRISEGLALTPRLLDAEAKRVVFRTLKRRKLVYRAVPIPAHLMRDLITLSHSRTPDDRLFPWSRQTGWRHIKVLMAVAEISGPQATAKGLRHQFGIHAIGQKIPEGTLQRWMGHAKGSSTQIYTFAVGAEERELAKRMW